SCAGEGRCLPGMAGERVRRFSVATRGRRGTRLTSRPSAGARVRGVRAQARRCPDVENATRHSSCLIDAGLTAADSQLAVATPYERSRAVRWWRATYLWNG